MKANGVRTAVVVTALTMLVGVAAIAGNEPVRHFAPEAPQPSPDELERIGVITSGFPVPGALPPEVYPLGLLRTGYRTGPDAGCWSSWPRSASSGCSLRPSCSCRNSCGGARDGLT